ncbi:MAG: 2OG-Fe(II) oxygenase [Hyphomicrobiaceae bacterium]|nr:2OG-Fe(II) oxygenase [Hyphomicrobiaceae bacterium]
MSLSIDRAPANPEPYPHWFLKGCLPHECAEAVRSLPFAPPSLGGISGKRELHNATRIYFDIANRAKFPVVEAIAAGFQSPVLTHKIETAFGTELAGSYLRIEYAQDTGGFWLEPHTDLGVKVFTMLLYMSTDPRHASLGTDIYDADKKHVSRSPFEPNGAMIFVPSDDTFHGFESRDIPGVRQSLIINYVTEEWRAREQLAYPDKPIGA